MSTYYVDPAAGGANNGTSWADAWADFQSAVDAAAAGDTVYCRGTQTLSSVINDTSLNSGDTTSGHIKFVGCDAGGTARAGQFTLDGNNAVTRCLDMQSGVQRISFENFTFKRTTSASCVDVWKVQAYYWLFRQCVFELSGSSNGAQFAALQRSHVDQCIFRNNGNAGVWCAGACTHFTHCAFYGNGNWGVTATYGFNTVYGCLFYENAQGGLSLGGDVQTIVNCAFDGGSGDDGLQTGNRKEVLILGCRFTNNAGYGIGSSVAADESKFQDWCVFYNNTAGAKENAWGGGLHSDESPADDGYVDADDDDYNIKSGAELRRVAVNLDFA